MREEVIPVAFQVVADEPLVVAVGDEAHTLGEERIFDLFLLKSDRPLLARDLGQPGDLVDQLARRPAPQREGEFHAERQPMHDRRQRESNQRCGKRAAEDHDRGMGIGEHPQVATHQDERDQHNATGEQT